MSGNSTLSSILERGGLGGREVQGRRRVVEERDPNPGGGGSIREIDASVLQLIEHKSKILSVLPLAAKKFAREWLDWIGGKFEPKKKTRTETAGAT